MRAGESRSKRTISVVNAAIDAGCWNQRKIRTCGHVKTCGNRVSAGGSSHFQGNGSRRPDRRAHHLSAQQVSRTLCQRQRSEHVDRLHSVGIASRAGPAGRELFGLTIPANAGVQRCRITLLVDKIRCGNAVGFHVNAHPLVTQRSAGGGCILQGHLPVRRGRCCRAF